MLYLVAYILYYVNELLPKLVIHTYVRRISANLFMAREL